MPEADKTLSVIVPAFNEEATAASVVGRLLSLEIPGWRLEVILVDDGSTDGTVASLVPFAGRIKVLRHESNRGKGAAVATGLAAAAGEVVLVQDADLEYDPGDIPTLTALFDDPKVDAVFGSRNLRAGQRGYFGFYWGGRMMTAAMNLLYGSRLTDINTGYKAVRTGLLKSLGLTGGGFEFCEEVTAKLLRRGVVIKEVPIGYHPRSFKEGKKIGVWDGLIGLWTIIRNRF